MQENSVKCTGCKKWIHKRCGGVCGGFSLVVDGFRCSAVIEADLVKDLVVDGGMYGCVKSFLLMLYGRLP